MTARSIDRLFDKFREMTARPYEVTPADASGGPGMRRLGAALLRGADDLAKDLARCHEGAKRLDGHDIRVFASSVCDPFLPSRAHEPAALFGPWPRGLFGRVWIGRTVRLYDNPWGRAFLARANEMLTPGGEMLVPAENTGRCRGVLQLDMLTRVLGEPKQVHRGGVASIARSDSVTMPDSVLSWYTAHTAELILEDLRMRLLGAASPLLEDPLCTEFLGSSRDLSEASATLSTPDTRADLAGSIELAVRRQTYQVGGMSHKSTVMRQIIEDHASGDGPLAMADMGGGYGLLAAELLMDPDCRVGQAVNVDLSPFNIALSVLLYRGLRHALAGRFGCWYGPSQEYQSPASLDVVSFIGSLLYVPREHTRTALDRAWDSLAPGGILVVHENIKSPAYKADYDKMFTVEEIDSLLSSYGEITRYATMSPDRLSQREAADGSVYRVVVKGH
jgi:hypothetical protein